MEHLRPYGRISHERGEWTAERRARVQSFLAQCDGFFDALFDVGAVDTELAYEHTSLSQTPSWASTWTDGTLSVIHMPDASFASDCRSEREPAEEAGRIARSRAHVGVFISKGHNAHGQLAWFRLIVSTQLARGVRNADWMQSRYTVSVTRGTIVGQSRTERKYPPLTVEALSAEDGVMTDDQRYILARLSECVQLIDALSDQKLQGDDWDALQSVESELTGEWTVDHSHLDRSGGAA